MDVSGAAPRFKRGARGSGKFIGNMVRMVRWAIALAALLIIGWSLVRMWQRRQESKPREPQRVQAEPAAKTEVTQPPELAGQPGVDAREITGSVSDWSVAAAPDLWRDGQPFAGQLTSLKGSDRGSPRIQRQLDPAAGRNGSKPAIIVAVTIDIDGEDAPPPLWPDAGSVELVRAFAEGGPYEVVRSLPETEFELLMEVDSGSPSESPEPYKRRHQFYLVDATVEPGRSHFYRVRFRDANNGLVAESGPCATLALAVPEVSAKIDEAGFPIFKWPETRWKGTDLIDAPRLIFSIQGVHQIGRFPFKAGTFECPVKVDSAISRRLRFEIGVEARGRIVTWDQRNGWVECTNTVQLVTEAPLMWPDLVETDPLKIDARERRDEFALLLRTSPETGTGEIISEYRESPFITTNTWFRGSEGAVLHRDFNLTEPAGVSERVAYHYGWQKITRTPNRNETENVGMLPDPRELSPPRTTVVSFVRSPLPTGFMAQPGDRRVVLRWDALSINPTNWVEGPTVSVLRADLQHVTVSNHLVTLNSTVEIFRGPATARGFTDTGLTNGTLYCYALAVEGVTKGRSWAADVGHYPCYLPIQVRTDKVAARAPIVAVPRTDMQLRVALFPEVNAPVVHAALVQTARHFSRVPGIELVERATVAPFLAESTIGKIQAALVPQALPADIVLRFKTRRLGYQDQLDVWLEDYGNVRRERLFSLPVRNLDLARTAAKLQGELAARFPRVDSAPPHLGSITQLPLPVKTIIIGGFEPFTEESRRALPADASIEAMLHTALATTDNPKIVERDRSDTALRELGLTTATSVASLLRLGQLAKADALLTGAYGLKNKQLVLALRLVNVADGRLLRSWEAEGTLNHPTEWGPQVTQPIQGIASGKPADAVNPVVRWLEARSSDSAAAGLAQAEAPVYLTPERASYHLQAGQQHRARGELARALASFQEGLFLAATTDNPWPYYEAVAETLRAMNQRTEEAELWNRVIAERERQQLDTTAARSALAQAQLAPDQEPAAAPPVAVVVPPPVTSAAGGASSIEQSLNAVVDEVTRASGRQGPLSDVELQAYKDVQQTFSGVQREDAAGLREFATMLEGGKTSLHRLLAVGLVERLMPERRFVPHLLKDTQANTTKEFTQILANTCATIGDESAIPELISRLPHVDTERDSSQPFDPRVTQPVVTALEALSGKSFGDHKPSWQVWWHRERHRN